METFAQCFTFQVEASILSICPYTVWQVAFRASPLRDLSNQVTEFSDPVRRSSCVADQWKWNDLAHIA